MARVWVAFLLLPLAFGPAIGRKSPQPNQHGLVVSSKAPDSMKVDTWFGLGMSGQRETLTRNGNYDIRLPPDRFEQITVFAPHRALDQEWRADIRARDPAYEAINSDAAQPLLPFPVWTSPEQQRLMSTKTDLLGLCGALGGYIQCPNKAP